MAKLSKREKTLIIFAAAIAVICALVFLIVVPAMTHLNMMGDEISDLEMRRQEMENKVATLSFLRKTYGELKPDVETGCGTFFDAGSNTDIDMFITNFCIARGLQPSSLEISQAGALIPPTGENTGPEASEVENTGDEDDTPLISAVSAVTVTLNLAGDFEAVTRLINDTLSEPFMRIKALRYSSENTNIGVVFELFMQEYVSSFEQ